MAKKNPPPPPTEEPPEGHDIIVRGLSLSLVEALNRHAKLTRRSRNLAVLILLEEAMRKEGLWPPTD